MSRPIKRSSFFGLRATFNAHYNKNTIVHTDIYNIMYLPTLVCQSNFVSLQIILYNNSLDSLLGNII